MVLQDYRQIIARGFVALEKENLSSEGIAAVCDIRRAAGELYEQASNYQDALMLLNRLTKSAVDDARPQDVFSNPFWDMQEANQGKTVDPFTDALPREEEQQAPLKPKVKKEEEPVIDKGGVKSEPEVRRSSIRGSGRIVPTSKMQSQDAYIEGSETEDAPIDDVAVETIELDDDVLDTIVEADAVAEPGDDFSDMFSEEEPELFIDDENDIFVEDNRTRDEFIGVTAEMLREAEDFSQPDASDEADDAAVDTLDDISDEPDDIASEQGVFEADELPEYAMSYADDPYLLADDFIENLDDEDMELFIQIGSGEDDISDDIVRPGSLEKSGPKEEPKETPQEAVENARDKFYMPARSRIAMIRGAEPEDSFTGFDLLSEGYTKDEPDETPELSVPTEDELANAESEFEDEVDLSEPVGPSAVLEKVDPPEIEERDEEDPSFDVDQLGIPVDQPLLMTDDEYEKQFRVDMTTTIAEQSAQAEQYMDKFNKLATIDIGRPSVSDDEADSNDDNEN